MRIPLVGALAALLLLVSGCADGDDAGEDAPVSEDAASAETPVGADETSDGPADGPAESVQPSEAAAGTGRPAAGPDSEPDSVHVLVNKQNPLDPLDYTPDDLRHVDAPHEFEEAPLREEAAGAYEELHAAADEAGLELWATTAHRDYDFQQTLYEQRLFQDGAAAADRVSARPGHSEHQTGLAVDVADLQNRECYLRTCFGDTEQGRWLEVHAAEFGFIIRYPEGAEEITGFDYEPWHLRYVGEEAARAVTERGLTLEEYWDQPPAPDYENEYEPSTVD
ncbi:M15 family metallopeptidase [Nesterenkonia lutea]|uniref:D-alanyl-D-alanine carboxypeptidase n=1 Tax=Nesterenkonia lutea TaxID=272919 RepID=A0ABR9JEW0_9MICC|nr:M15 family metallopeptidase [Nesterenkonia lutea]MBE1524308.1 D-alanyl-D-alanine carboxypeptidase [Nesterenkonia lutea]